MERTQLIFGNVIPEKVVNKAVKARQKHTQKFGDDSQKNYPLRAVSNTTLIPFIGVQNIEIAEMSEPLNTEKGIIVGNIRMGFGHYRISMAIASAANAMGYTPYWFDLHAYQQTTGGKVIAHLNNLYSMGSRWSQKYSLFNKFYWEPLNSEGFKKLTYNAMDQQVAQLMTPVFRDLPKEMPFIGTHVWPAQAAVHAGMKRVVNVIPDNWPMALHLAEGALHTVQTPSAYIGYKTLKGMDGHKCLKPMPDDSLFEVGHYIDHELVANLASDTAQRLHRLEAQKAKQILLTVGGAGAQKEIFAELIKALLPKAAKGEVTIFINVGDHKGVWEGICSAVPSLAAQTTCHFDNWQETCTFAEDALNGEVSGIHAFYHADIFAAVYASNLLMRASDLLVTKPSELAFYPIPKLMIKRVGGHEAWGAIRAAEVGDGTVECESTARAVQMLSLMLETDKLLQQMNGYILRAHQAGIYNGAYKAVALAVDDHDFRV